MFERYRRERLRQARRFFWRECGRASPILAPNPLGVVMSVCTVADRTADGASVVELDQRLGKCARFDRAFDRRRDQSVDCCVASLGVARARATAACKEPASNRARRVIDYYRTDHAEPQMSARAAPRRQAQECQAARFRTIRFCEPGAANSATTALRLLPLLRCAFSCDLCP